MLELLKEDYLTYSVDFIDHIPVRSAAHVVSIHHAPIFDFAQERTDFPHVCILQAPSKEHLQISVTDVMETLKRVHLRVLRPLQDFPTKAVPARSVGSRHC